MKNIIINLIKIAEKTENIEVQCEILEEVKNLIYELARTYNCPSNWRDIGEELAEELNTTEYHWIYETLQLWDYADNY